MDDGRLLELLEKHPEMFGLDGGFRDVTLFLDGVDLAKEGAFFSGFREWLVVEIGTGNNLSWQALVLRLALPEKTFHPEGIRGLSPIEDQAALEALFDALTRFRQARGQQNGLVRIFNSYLKWVKRQEWYKPGSPHFLD